MRFPFFTALCAAILLTLCVHAEEHSFATEVDKVKDIIIRSLYKTKEIFVRELISNSADAIEKIRVLGLTNKDFIKLDKHSEFNISISPDKERSLLIISDNGIGMTKQDLIKNLGTIGKSGTADFLSQKLTGDNNLIGQFGVGFYSVYLVADVVEVISKHPMDKQYKWRSDAGSKFTIEEDDFKYGVLEHGTKIILHLKKKLANDYTSVDTLRTIVQKHSEFVPFPVHLNMSKVIESEAESDEELKKGAEKLETEESSPRADENPTTSTHSSSDKDEDEDEELNSDDDTDKTKDLKKKTKKVSKTVFEMQHINVQKPIWMRDQSEVNKSDYNNFARSVFKLYNEPQSTIFFKGEGNFNFRCLLFIPKRPEHTIFHISPEKYVHNIRLFVRRVFITDELIDFLPRFLSFLKGLIDSDDFPLNVSRENIQKTRQLAQIKGMLINKAIGAIEDISKNVTTYEEFYQEYSGYVKVGVMENEGKLKLRMAKLLRFHSTHNKSESIPSVSLDDYIKRMRVKQTVIYYLTGDSVYSMRSSPYVEMLVSRGYEVLLFDDVLDEYMTQKFSKYGAFGLRNVAKGGIEFGDESKDEKDELLRLKTKFEPLTNWFTKLLTSSIEETQVSKRLTTFACAIVANDQGWTGGMQRIMGTSKSDPMSTFYKMQKKRLEINPNHPIMLSILAKIEAETVDDDVEDLARSLYDMALIAGNYPLEDAAPIVKRIENAIRLGLGIDLSSQASFSVKPAPVIDSSLRPPSENNDGFVGNKPSEESEKNLSNDDPEEEISKNVKESDKDETIVADEKNEYSNEEKDTKDRDEL